MREKRRRRRKVKVVMYVSLPLLLTTNKVQVTRQSYKVSLVSSILTPPYTPETTTTSRRHAHIPSRTPTRQHDMHVRRPRFDAAGSGSSDQSIGRTHELSGPLDRESLHALGRIDSGLHDAASSSSGRDSECADLQPCPLTRSIKP